MSGAAVPQSLEHVVIVGGGTAGWMTAAGLVTMLGAAGVRVTLIESEAIGIVGVGEATLPHIKAFNDTLGIDEAEFMRATSATMKLGIEFVDWGRKGDAYIHPFGDFGIANEGVPFHHFWRRFAGDADIGRLDDYSLPIIAAKMARFQPPSEDARSALSTFRYAYQFDALQYAPFMRSLAEGRGVTRIEGRVTRVEQHGETGDIRALELEGGERIEGDLFVDCSGFYGVMIEQALATGYDEWTQWLPCNRAVAVPCESAGPLLPFTRASADKAGWRWRIPLQHRTGNGHVYASDFIGDDQAAQALLDGLDGAPLADPRPLRFTTGKRRKLWNHNCVAVGLSGGFLEPLESTSIYLIQEGITKLLELFPRHADFAVARDEYNRRMDLEFERIRDFLILHYHATTRDDSEFWNHVRTMEVPDSLKEKIALFRSSGRVAAYDQGLFLVPSWVAVMIGQGIMPQGWDWRADRIDEVALRQQVLGLRQHLQRSASQMSDHRTYLRQHGMGAQVA